MIYSRFPLNDQTIRQIQAEYKRTDMPWFLGYSGGKDSSALLKLVFIALLNLEIKKKPVTIIYCDTGVEIPLVRNLAVQTLKHLEIEAERYNVPMHVKIAYPKLEDRYFVKVIGRGYPPPSNKFRWCTDRLRINPVKQVLDSVSNNKSIVLLGVRRGESQERDKTISRHETGDQYFFNHSTSKSSLIYSPIINYGLEEVWDTLTANKLPESIKVGPLLQIYKQAGGECPIIRDPKGSACSKGRFGCWTCTVVRQDRAVTNLVEEGHLELRPLLEFRNWLMEIRDKPEYRCKRRRNGMPGLGPFTLAARQEILQQLLITEQLSNQSLISEEEVATIKNYWRIDATAPNYTET